MSSIRIRFEPSGFEVDAEPGEAIMDITDANPAADVPIGYLRVVVMSADLTPRETEVLERLARHGRVSIIAELLFCACPRPRFQAARADPVFALNARLNLRFGLSSWYS
jgi:hypothetical protein